MSIAKVVERHETDLTRMREAQGEAEMRLASVADENAALRLELARVGVDVDGMREALAALDARNRELARVLLALTETRLAVRPIRVAATR